MKEFYELFAYNARSPGVKAMAYILDSYDTLEQVRKAIKKFPEPTQKLLLVLKIRHEEKVIYDEGKYIS